ncbi:MAG: HAD-IA family hydrolase [Clostridiales bacterium]|nr:HAD-IA family hydrolase [Clostridiales bacterium]
MEAYIWDLDGTLLDSYPVIIAAAIKAAADAGVHDDEAYALRIAKQDMLFTYLKDVAERSGTPFKNVRERYRAYTHEMDDRIILMDGAREALERLQNAGAAHYVFTHRGTSSEPILERLGILGYFREIVTSAAGFPAKPSGEAVRYLMQKYGLKPDETWYVGDRPIDVLCAEDAGVRSVLLLPEGACVTPTGHEDRIIRSLNEL